MFSNRKLKPTQDELLGKLLKLDEESIKMYEGVKKMT